MSPFGFRAERVKAMLFLPEEQTIDQFAQFGKLPAFPLHPVRSAGYRFIRPAAATGIDELIERDSHLFKPLWHLPSPASQNRQECAALLQPFRKHQVCLPEPDVDR